MSSIDKGGSSQPPFLLGVMQKKIFGLLIGVVFVLGGGIYLPGVTGYFLFDDIINIVQNSHLRIQTLDVLSIKQAMASSEAGILGRPLSMLSFALNYYSNGLNPFVFKLTNVCIHLVNGACIFFLSRLLLLVHRRQALPDYSQSAADWTSLVICAAWLLHPLNLTGVLFVVQRMTSLSALFTLLGLISYVYGRTRMLEGKVAWLWILSPFVLFTPLAMLCKENGALLPVFLMLVEVVFFRFITTTLKAKWLILALFSVSVLLPMITLLVLTLWMPEWITVGYFIRDFSLAERLMTEARVVWFYIQLIAVPDISQLGMYHDDIPISKSLLDPLSTLAAVVGMFVLGVAALLSIRRYPIAAFGVLFFLIGHSIESTVIALELVHEHRNYLPMYGLLFAFLYYLLCPLMHPESIFIRRIVVGLFVLMLAGVTALRAIQWGDPVEMRLREVEHHPASIRANISIAAFYAVMPSSSTVEAEDFYQRAYTHYAKAAELSPADTLGLFGLIELHARNALPIEDEWINALAGRIEHYPFAPSTGNSIAALEKCVSAQKCNVTAVSMEHLILAALKNPTLHSRAKIQVLFSWSNFLFAVKGDVEAAMREAMKAADANIYDVDNQITLITMLINMNKLVEAQARIDLTRKTDQRRLYTMTLDDREKSIIRLRATQRKG
ncbi:hypothetical protein ACLIKD_01730 [Azonexus sp. IMCC34842]|uniref:hypothetical protein n=1 Tax=Azonexus sp. IMCC34842 TaxID=3420950 RepID=UPI003D0D41D7